MDELTSSQIFPNYIIILITTYLLKNMNSYMTLIIHNYSQLLTYIRFHVHVLKFYVWFIRSFICHNFLTISLCIYVAFDNKSLKF